MPALNILIVSNNDSKALKMVLKSKYVNKLYTNFQSPDSIDIKFNTFKELSMKCKSLKIDLVFVEDEKLIFQGIADVLKSNYINCIALTSYWTQLVLSNSFANKMLEKYELSTPDKLSYPSEFPIVVRGDGILKFANSLQEVIEIKQDIFNKYPVISETVYLEKFIEGEEFNLTSLFDGKTVITNTTKDTDKNIINNYSKKLETMFAKENPNFIGYINARAILSNNILYILGFNLNIQELNTDFMFLLISAIYQKLDEYRQNNYNNV